MIISFVNRNLPEDSFKVLTEFLSKRFAERKAELTIGNKGDIVLSLGIDDAMKADSYSIREEGGITYVDANNLCTVFAAVGRYVIRGTFDHKGGFKAPELPIVHVMNNSLRGMYFASHFHNFYHESKLEEVNDIIMDQALTGCNTLVLCFALQHYTSTKTPEAQEFIARMKEMYKFAALCGIAPAIILFSNTSFKDGVKPEFAVQTELDDSGRYYRPLRAEFINEICPSNPEGFEEIKRQQREFFEAFADTPIKYFVMFAYDEGGCLCEKCYPWTTNGFMKIADYCRELIEEYKYDAKIIISGWHFTIKLKDEWNIFFDEMKTGKYSWSPYLMTSFRDGRMPKVFVENKMPDGMALIDFPEISMCNAKPWGGFGANPITMFLDNVYQNCGAYHDGGFPYSEGIYEDINKWVCLGFYTGHYKNSADAVRDYIRYNFGIEDTTDLLRAIQLMESSLPRGTEKLTDDGSYGATEGLEGIQETVYRFPIRWGTAIPEIYRIVTEYDKKIPEGLKNSWKWRIVYLRGIIDKELLDNGYVTKYSEVAQKAYHEMHEISHTWNAKFCVHPPEGM